MFIGVICRSIVFSWAIICVFGQSTPTPHEGDTDGACLGNPCDENGPCFNRPTTVDGKTQYVCECPDNMIYTGDLCDQFGGPTNDKETCFGRDCYVGFFTSPNYPNGYLPRHRKIYTLYAPGAKSVTFTTHENFSVESHKDEFYIGTGLTYPTTLDFVNKTSDPLQYVFQGYTAAPPFSLPGNEFWMIFDTDRTVEFMGWRLDWIAYEQQSFDEEPMSINVTEGDDVMFNCSVLNKQGVMSWSKDGSEIINNDLNMVSSSGRYDIISNVENVEYNLLVQNVDRSSAGSYIAYVSAQNGHSAIQSQAAILVVHTAAIQRFVEQPSDVEIVEGNDTFLKCKIENKEGTVIWYKDGVAISSDASIINGDLRLSIIGDHSAGEYYLAFLGLTVADAGNYSVVVTAADNSPEIRSEEAALTVLRHQWFIRTPESLSIVEGQTLNLHVTVGNKRGTLSWIKDGYIVLNYDLAVAVNDARVSISNPSQGVYDLVITDVTLADAGTYQVSVTGGDSDNPISTTAITLSVNDLETQSFVRTPESAEIAVSSRFVLHSQVDHREGDVIWSRNGVDISLNGAITNGDSRYSITGDPSLGEYHLMIDNVQHSDAGNFKVRVTAADNSPEIESADASVTTREHQWFITTPESFSIVEGQTLTLHVTVGNKQGTLSWIKDGHIVLNYDLAVAVNDARVSISNPSTGVYDLVITDVTLADAGTYQVSVTGGDSDNPISTTAITLSVNDLETQSFVRTPESAEIAVSSRFVLHSQVDHREGDVIWSRNGVDISLNGAITNGDSRYSITGDPSLGEYHLVIDNVQHSDAGNFKVRVTAADNSPEIESADVGVTTRGPTEPLSDYPKCSLERINNNKTLQLTCESRGGDPPAALEWTRDGSVIVGSIAAASNSTGSKHVLEMESTYSLEGAIFTCVSSHVTFTESKMCMIGPLETGTSRIPDDNFPKCSIANENLILDDSALLICETRGGIPPATLEWSKDGVIYEGQWMNTETETVNGLLLNLTADLEGAVFVCSSDHPSYEETKTCEIGPLKFTSSPWYSSPWIWLLLGLLLLALLILLIILLICCCCCGRRRYCFCADACLAICPCCTCCKGVKHADAATMVETDTADTAIIVHSTYAGSPRKSEISTQTPGYLTEKPLYLLENSHLNASNHVRTDYRSEKIKTRTRDQETGRTRSEADEVEKEDTAKKNAKNKKSLDGEKSKETSGKNADHDARGAEHRESHVTNINETNYYLLPNSSAVTGSTHNAKGDYVTSCSSSDSDKDKDSLGGSGGKKKRKSRKSESRNAQVKRQESDITDDQRRVLNRQHRTRMSVDSFVPLSRPDDRNEPEGGNVEDSMEKTGVKGSAENTGDQKSEAKVDDPRNQKAMKDHHTNLAESQTVDSYRDESETTDNLSRTGGSYAKRKTEQTRTLETEFDGDRKGITMNGHVAMSGITQNELSKLVKKQSKLDASLTAPPTSDYSPRLSHSLTSTTKGDPLSYSINSDNITVGNRRAALRTLSTHLKRRPYRITPDAVRWGKTRPEALAREFPAGSADIEDFEAVRNLRSMRITTDFGIFSAWDPEYTSTTLRLTGGYEDDSEV